MSKIILITDVYQLRQQKQQELEFYHKELEKLQLKLQMIRLEINLTNDIIDLINSF